MTFLDATSSHMLSMIAAIYGVFIYSISFSLEMWFIVSSPSPSATGRHPSSHPPAIVRESWSNPSSYRSQQTSPLLRLQTDTMTPFRSYSSSSVEDDLDNSPGSPTNVPLFAFILAAMYFVIVMVSLLLILGIIIRSMMCILTWLITIVLMFLPEGALVLFITIYTWGIDSRNGQIELCFYVIRVILNVFFVISVQSLLTHWKSEKQASKFAFNLNTYNSYPPFTSTSISSGSHFPSTTSPYIVDSTCSTTVNPVFKFATLRGSQFDTRHFPSINGVYGGYDSSGCDSGVTENGVEVDYVQFRRRKSSDDRDVYLTYHGREAGSLKVKRKRDNMKNMSSHHPGSYTTKSLDRRKFSDDKARKGILKFSVSFKDDVSLVPLSTKPLEYLSRPGSTLDVSSDQKETQEESTTRDVGVYSSQTLPRDFETRASSSSFVQNLQDVTL